MLVCLCGERRKGSERAVSSGGDHSNEARLAAQLAAIVSSSDDAIVGKTLQGIVTSWNSGATRIFGYTEEEMVGQRITKIIPRELWSEEDDILAKLCRGEHIDHFETIRIAKDGRRIDVSVTVSPIRDGSGQLIGASKVGRDITERKQAQKVQELLISELNHRVKNTLAMVQSIANQTAYRAKSAGDFAASFGGRLQALSRTHTLLTATTWRGAELSEIMRDQLLIDGGEDGRVSFSGPSVMLSPQAALHTGLVLHELATNAHKYGALSTPRGNLSLRWMVRTEGQRKLYLQWQERGGPAVTVPETRGFGSTLIEKSLDAHGGTASIHYEAEGLTCEIVLPLKENELLPFDALNKAAAAVAKPFKSVENPVRATGVEGKRILVVDDEPLIAMDIATSLDDDGCVVVGPASTIEKALTLIETTDIDAALLDANLAGDPVDVLAAALTRRKIPFAFVTGYGREGLPKAFQKAALIKKPFQRSHLVEIVQQLTTEPTGTVPLERPHEPFEISHS
jgi:PAS domain S-box-containing protein